MGKKKAKVKKPMKRKKSPPKMNKRKSTARSRKKAALKKVHKKKKARPARALKTRKKAKVQKKAVRKAGTKAKRVAKGTKHPKKRAPKRKVKPSGKKAARPRRPPARKTAKPGRKRAAVASGEPIIPEDAEKLGEPSEFRVKVQNIVAFTNLGKPVSLEKLLKTVENTEWQPEQFPGLVYKIKYPRASALIFSQGKIVCTGTKSLEELKTAMIKIVDRIRQAGIEMPRTYEIKVENIVASTKIKADLNLDEIAFMLENSEYEPEQFPGLVYRISEPRVAFLLFTSGRIICAGAQNVNSIHRALKKFKENLEAIGVKVEPVREE